jgi:hypothetical protein
MPRVPALLAALFVPAIAFAQPSAKVEVGAGDMVTVRIAGDGKAIVDARSPAGPLPDTDAAFLEQMRTVAIVPDVKSQPAIPGRSPTPPPPVTPHLLRIGLRAVPPPAAKGPNGDMLLSIENGYDGALRYRAVLHRGGNATPTDVCIVLPLKRGFEHWPYPFDRVELSDLRIVPWHEGDTITCE